MATHLSIDPALIARVRELRGARTKKAAVTLTLGEFIARRRQRGLLELMGKQAWDPDYDTKDVRQRSAHKINSRWANAPDTPRRSGSHLR